MSIGYRIKKAREARHLSQAELARLCGWEGAQGRISHYEIDRVSPPMTAIASLAIVLKVSQKWLVFGEFAEKEKNLAFLDVKSFLPIIEEHEIFYWLGLSASHKDRDKFMNSHTVMPFNEPCSQNTFIVKMPNDALVSPHATDDSVQIGALLYVDPEHRPKTSDIVLCAVDDKFSVVVRKYVEEGASKKLVAFNSQYETIKVTDEMRIIGTVVFELKKRMK